MYIIKRWVESNNKIFYILSFLVFFCGFIKNNLNLLKMFIDIFLYFFLRYIVN